ncbi:MAG: hypothetical protein A3F94_02285 [Candidatus Spechtbacteria bacterium RIFCSPLOWO2_12_FULL_38_22]|uniref:SIS domain-containing protein n=1 Tax=Candidatus Spechtbacteria bacterium RIFCSPLOWO2_12_FULL_38_22 TaxID=1802165 RepID=A0A1G2HGJ2_9BACT|nr:MAG: hypothetical protein A3F94_02285 [Candidatus Spechtbacteria bacterium RIFCSPLOWO2_12_FULL_38_22]
MGGSALPGLLLESLMASEKITVHRDYELPQNITKNTFVVVMSYSGNTEEAISAYKTAKKQNLPLAAVASGGELEKLTQKDKTAYIKVPSEIQPRIALGYQFMALVELTKAPKPQNINIDAKKIEQDAKLLAKKINTSIPLFYASTQNKALAYIAKIQTNETAKRHAFYNIFPELNHNELEAWNMEHEAWNMEQFVIIMLKDKSDDKRIVRKMNLTAKLIEKKGYHVKVVDVSNVNWYNKVIHSVLFTNWLSYYLAIDAGIDPKPVNLIEEFKGLLRLR